MVKTSGSSVKIEGYQSFMLRPKRHYRDVLMANDQLLSEQEFQLLQKGHEPSFQKVYEAYYGLIQYIIQRCGVDHEEKRDLIQETFLKLHTKAHEIKDAAAIKPWLVSCARHLAVDYQRRKKFIPLSDPDANHAVSQRADESQTQHNHELEVRLVGHLIQEVCAQEQDDTLKLFYIDGLKAREIAELRGEAVSTITTRLGRLRQKFRHVFEQRLERLEKGGSHGQ
ncbi:MAG: sigma-70 family RNA polymerase sigma factor [Pseudobdellovibrionaceae bacterium]|nr:sigma-70 family RNA polymerase sigma factor [Pseudobdellovibrionaceae bacterium]